MAAITALRCNPHIIIRPADKNMSLCVVKRDWYVNKCLDHLLSSRDFVEIQEQCLRLWIMHQSRLRHLLRSLGVMLKNGLLNAFRLRLSSHVQFLESSLHRTIRLPAFYGLVEVHESPPALRPIVACHSWITTEFSRVCAYELHLLIRRDLPHILRDSSHLVKLIEAIDVPREYSTSSFRLITGDVEGLYVNIPMEEAISRVTSLVHSHTDEFFA
jgi:hypothetical protein